MIDVSATTVSIPYVLVRLLISTNLEAKPSNAKKTKNGSHLNNISSATAQNGIRNNEFVNSEVLATCWLKWAPDAYSIIPTQTVHKKWSPNVTKYALMICIFMNLTQYFKHFLFIILFFY
jgi:hypothetical protein